MGTRRTEQYSMQIRSNKGAVQDLQGSFFFEILAIKPNILFALAVLTSLWEFQAVTRSQSIYTPEILKILDLLKNSITQMHFVGKGYLFFSNSHELIALSGVEIHLMLPAWAPMIKVV